MRTERERRHDGEVAPAAPNCPEQVRVVLRSSRAERIRCSSCGLASTLGAADSAQAHNESPWDKRHAVHGLSESVRVTLQSFVKLTVTQRCSRSGLPEFSSHHGGPDGFRLRRDSLTILRYLLKLRTPCRLPTRVADALRETAFQASQGWSA